MIRVHVRSRPDRPSLQLAWTDPLTGKIRTRSANTKNWKQAEREAGLLEKELRQTNGTVAASWQYFRERFEDEHLAGKTSAPYMAALNHFERLIGEPRDINSINASVISRFRAKLRKVVPSEQTVSKNLRHLRVALNFAESIDLLARAPKIKTESLSESERGRPLTLWEFCRMYQAATGEYKELLLCLWLSGLRLGEALKLSLKPPVKLELDTKYPRIVFSVSGQKSKRKEIMPITPAMSKFCRTLDLSKPKLFNVSADSNRESKQISAIGEHCGIMVSDTKFASAHDLRRSFGTRWALVVHPLVLKKMMRHKSLKTTLTYYVNLDADDVAEKIWNAASVHNSVHKTNHKLPQLENEFV